MNQKIAKQKEIKRRLGITFHNNMGPHEMLTAWNKIPPETLSLISVEVKNMMQLLGVNMGVVNTVYNAYDSAQKAYALCELLIDGGVAIMAGQPQQPILLSAKDLAKDQLIRVKAEVAGNVSLAVDLISSRLFDI